MTELSNNKIQAIVRACRIILRMIEADPDTRESQKMYYRMLLQYYTRLRDARENGQFIVAHTVFFPAEIILAMGLVPMHTETTTWMTSLFTGECSDILAAGSSMGMATEICAPHRGMAGAFANGAIPKPDVMVWSNMVCDNTAKSGELVMDICDCPGFFLDRPFKDSDLEKAYMADELRDMITFLEKQSGKKMDYDRLSEIVERTDRQIKLTREINELRKNVPTPFSPLGFLELLTIDYLFPGQPESVEYLETLKKEMEKAILGKKGAVPNERFRLMTLFIPPMYLMAFLERISIRSGAVSVIEPFFTFWGEGTLDASRPIEAVVEKSYMIPEARMYGPLGESALGAIKKCAREWRVDGAVYYADVGCRHSCATIKLFKDTLADVDVPVLTLDCDVVDQTVTSEDEVKEKLERFFELLEDR
ncbi:MAG: 2-hydroxyacyl-CoA dehydratase family protein [Dehalococcoidales bacterium]|jgi:benzoyl-CoA reductase/2-hydroxyglutaryl-CoA dehydratase subunit BcrC/BadD/HgdB|nr:2-hydroxyacyl-CoA dehydratase family protein [Dehalococcoidales bacterium]MDX9985831.1 2-hydroxyacyl-CoA dehydratase family protein [Dehalococcoidales bacterium]NLE90176.1 2-hydroxyacyl-CoA dehydratase [Dehalococcoidales bacterium]